MLRPSSLTWTDNDFLLEAFCGVLFLHSQRLPLQVGIYERQRAIMEAEIATLRTENAQLCRDLCEKENLILSKVLGREDSKNAFELLHQQQQLQVRPDIFTRNSHKYFHGFKNFLHQGREGFTSGFCHAVVQKHNGTLTVIQSLMCITYDLQLKLDLQIKSLSYAELHRERRRMMS